MLDLNRSDTKGSSPTDFAIAPSPLAAAHATIFLCTYNSYLSVEEHQVHP